jgi:hypothetical protein
MDDKQAAATHARWAKKIGLNRDTSDPDYPESWCWEQCGGCRHWVPVDGPLGGDWGVCSNARSPLDATLRFEHDGCDVFEAADPGEAPFT